MVGSILCTFTNGGAFTARFGAPHATVETPSAATTVKAVRLLHLRVLKTPVSGPRSRLLNVVAPLTEWHQNAPICLPRILSARPKLKCVAEAQPHVRAE